MRLLIRVVPAVVAAVLLPVAAAVPAQADSFRFWGYYQWADGEWAFAPTGPAETVPADGDVEGWRYAIGDDTTTRTPRTGDVFDEICADASAGDGQKRVAVVLDYGTADDAPDGDEPPEPRGECAVVDDEATGADILAGVAQVRIGDDGLTCGIDGFPSTDCGSPVEGPAPAGDDQEVELAIPETAGDTTADEPADEDGATALDGDGQQIGLIAGIAAVVLVGVALLVRMRRSRNP